MTWERGRSSDGEVVAVFYNGSVGSVNGGQGTFNLGGGVERGVEGANGGGD